MRRSPQLINDLKPLLADAAMALSSHPNEISVQALAKAAGLAIGTIYRIIPAKSDLFEIVQYRAEEKFNNIVFAPIRGGQSLRVRFELIFNRIFEFVDSEPDAAKFLALHGFSTQSLFLKSSTAFSDEGIKTNLMRQNIAPMAHALIWGPIAVAILQKANDIKAKDLEECIWHTLAA